MHVEKAEFFSKSASTDSESYDARTQRGVFYMKVFLIFDDHSVLREVDWKKCKRRSASHFLTELNRLHNRAGTRPSRLQAILLEYAATGRDQR